MALDSEDRTLYIGNLHRNVSEEILYELFLQAGPVERVNIQANNNDSFRYGFVTYKHQMSVDYAIELFKGTNLFKREISVKRKGERSNNNGQLINDFKKQEILDQTFRSNSGFTEFAQDQLLQFQQSFLQTLNDVSQPLLNFTSNSLKGNWSSRNKPYDRDSKNHFSRPWESRDRHKYRNYESKYHGRRRNNRH